MWFWVFMVMMVLFMLNMLLAIIMDAYQMEKLSQRKEVLHMFDR